MVSTSPQTPGLALHTRGISSANARNKHIQDEGKVKEPFIPAVKESDFLKAYLLQGEHDYSARYDKAVSDAMTLPKTRLHDLYPAEYNSLRSRRQQAKERHIKFADSLKDLRDWLIHLGPRPYAGLTVDRIKTSKGYVPNNLRWANKFVQTQNRKVTRWHEMPDGHGHSLTTKQLATKLGLSYATLYKRLSSGWTIERLLQDQPPKTLKDWKFPDELTKYCEPLYRQTRKHFTTSRLEWFILHLDSVLHGDKRGNELNLDGLAFSNLLKHLTQARQDRQNIEQARKEHEDRKLRELMAIYQPPSKTIEPVTTRPQQEKEPVHVPQARLQPLPRPQEKEKEPVHVATKEEIAETLARFKQIAAARSD